MSAEREELERAIREWIESQQGQYPNTAELLEQALQVAREEAAQNEEEFLRQKLVIVERVIKPLGLDQNAALAQLPLSFPQKTEFHDTYHLTVPLLVPQFKDVSWLSAVSAVDLYIPHYLEDRIKAGDVHPWKDPRGIDAPLGPHCILLQNGTEWVDQRSVDVRTKLQQESCQNLFAGGLWVAFAQALLRPDMAVGREWVAVGESVVSRHTEVEEVVFLGEHNSKLGFLTKRADVAGPRSRALIFGR